MSPESPDPDPQMLERLLTDLFPSEWIRQTAGTVGFVRRRRTIDPVTFLWVLILGFGTGVSRSLASLRRAYETASGETLVPSAFYDRFTPACVAFLRAGFIRGPAEVVRHTSTRRRKSVVRRNNYEYHSVVRLLGLIPGIN